MVALARLLDLLAWCWQPLAVGGAIVVVTRALGWHDWPWGWTLAPLFASLAALLLPSLAFALGWRDAGPWA